MLVVIGQLQAFAMRSLCLTITQEAGEDDRYVYFYLCWMPDIMLLRKRQARTTKFFDLVVLSFSGPITKTTESLVTFGNQKQEGNSALFIHFYIS